MLKHKYAIAEALAWARAVSNNVPVEVAEKIAEEAARNVYDLAKGKAVDGFTIEAAKSYVGLYDDLEAEVNAEKQGYPNAE